MDLIDRAIAYVQRCPPAISGQGGHRQTFTVANALVRKFALDRETALRVLEDHHNPLCQPRWTRRELAHKVDSALRKGRGEIGAYANNRLQTSEPEHERYLPDVLFDGIARWLADACPLTANNEACRFLSHRKVLVQAQIAGFFALPQSSTDQGKLLNDAFDQFGEAKMIRSGLVKLDNGVRKFILPRNMVCIPWRRSDGTVQTIQRRFVGSGESRIRYATPRGRAPRYPFGVDRLETLRQVLNTTGEKPRIALTEGAMDALAIQAIAHNPNTIALAIPGVDGWRDTWTRFTRGAQEILLALDNDRAGKQCAEKLTKDLSESKLDSSVSTIYPPSAKDWGEYLVKHGR